MKYYAKSRNSQGEQETVFHHLQQVSALCQDFAAAFDCPGEGALLGLFHDLGKYSTSFQDVLQHQMQGVDHASPGAAALQNLLFPNKSQEIAENACHWSLVCAIAAHHSALQFDCFGSLSQVLSGKQSHGRDGKTLSLCGKEQLGEAIRQFRAENPCVPPPLRKESFAASDDPSLSRMLYGRMLFSALVDADYSASASNENPVYMEQTTEQLPDPAILCESLAKYCDTLRQGSQASPTLNEIRNTVFKRCQDTGSKGEGVFTLTAPTGTGKTMAMLAFALEQLRRGKRRIFFVLPFLSITEQNANEYRNILPNLLECHSQSNLSDEMREFAQRWSSYAIVTTSVQFFEGLFASRATDCRRLHQIANSVILFDEAQTLPPELAKVTLDTLNLLCERYHCTVVFSTATQPSFHKLPQVRWKPKEIIPNSQQMLFSCRRVQVDWNLQTPTSFSSIAEQMAQSDSICCIVNLRRHAKELFCFLEPQCSPDSVFFISSDLCPKHREHTLAKIRQRLKGGLPCRLVATQCIEAGVDISFAAMYRALAPLESIIQAAGRCNRHRIDTLGQMTVFVPEDEGRLYPGDFYEAGANAVKTVLSRHPIDINDLSHIEEYYSTLYAGGSVTQKPSLKSAIDQLDFEKTTEEYKLITQTGYQLIVPYEPTRDLFEAVRAEALQTGLTPKLMANLAPITVSCYQYEWMQTHCVPLPLRLHGKRGDGLESGWYALEDYGLYEDKLGLLLETTENLLY